MTATAMAPAPLRRSALDRSVAMRLAATEYDRSLDQLRALRTEDWSRPTDCAAWDVRALAGHVVGMTEMSASLLEQRRQMGAATKAPGEFIDALTALQVAKHAADTTAELVERYAVVSPRAARGRRRTPAVIRRRAMPMDQPVGATREHWTIGYLVDVILTRDVWMHRVDIATALGLELELTAEHDGALVADVVAEWAGRHGQPCEVTLTGPAGGRWAFGSGGAAVTADAVEFCRGLSGRGDAALDTPVPF